MEDAVTESSEIKKEHMICRESYGWTNDKDCFVGIKYGKTEPLWNRLSVYNSGKPIQIFDNKDEQKAKAKFMRLYPNETKHGSVAIPIGVCTHYMHGGLFVGIFINNENEEYEDESDEEDYPERYKPNKIVVEHISHTLQCLRSVSFRGKAIAILGECPHND